MGWLRGGGIQTLLPDTLTTPINRPLGDSPRGSSTFTTIVVFHRHLHGSLHPVRINLPLHPSHVRDRVDLGSLILIFGAHRDSKLEDNPDDATQTT
jgi:hypothetical protein